MPLGRKLNTRKDNILVQDLDKETLVYDLNQNKAYSLSETSALVWRELDGTKSADEISRAVSKKIGQDFSEDMVWLAVSQLKTENLLANPEEVATPFDGLSRREAVKRVGFASMVALPFISSLIAPSGAHAASAQVPTCGCFPVENGAMQSSPGCVCLASSDCCSGLCGIAGPFCLQTTTPTSPCCVTGNCPPQNGQGIAPGCGCLDNANCASGNCMGNICGV